MSERDAGQRYTLKEVAAFLDGSAPLDGVWFSERHPTETGAFWWRKHLRAAVASVEAAIRADAMREAARIAEATQALDWNGDDYWAAGYVDGKNAAATAILSAIGGTNE